MADRPHAGEDEERPAEDAPPPAEASPRKEAPQAAEPDGSAPAGAASPADLPARKPSPRQESLQRLGRATPTARSALGRTPSAAPKPVPVAQRGAPHTAPASGEEGRRPRRLATSGARDEPVPHTSSAPAPAQPGRQRVVRRRNALPDRGAPAQRDAESEVRGPQPAQPTQPVRVAKALPPAAAGGSPPTRPPADLPAPAGPPDAQPTRAALRRQRGVAVIDAPDTDAIVEDGPIVAPDTIAGRSLTMVVAIMTFLCAMLLGSAIVIERAAGAWSAQVLDDISVTILPLDGDPVARRTEDVARVLESLAGVSAVAVLSDAQTEALLEPWLGGGADLSLLPVPRMVTARRGPGFDPATAADALAAIPGASLDDHSAWSERLSNMAATVTGAAMAGLALMLVATAISIVFATRATIATNRATVEVLHILGADERFVQRAFRGRFMRIGVRGAAMGLAAAAGLFGVMEAWSMFSAGAASQQAAALLGAPRIGPMGFVGLIVLALLVALLVALTTRIAVRHHLKDISQ
ncbi:MAG: hypothetical protein AAGF49_07930 [Pseudomonadota bacterium]